VSSLTSLDNEAANDGKFHEQFVMLPFITLDGINDAGIFVNLNIVGFQEMGAWEMKTETTDDDMLELIGPRLILDNCSYLTDIVPLYEKYDWISLGKEDETHFMVTGPRSADDATVTSVVFELIPFTEGNRTYRRLCCISQDEKDIVLVGNDPSRFHHIKTDYLIMSNFNLWQFDPSLDRKGRLLSASAHPMGFERYETVEAVANSAAAIAGGKENLNRLQMQDIMRSVYYSNYCNLFNPNFWYSDFYPMYDKEDLISITEEQRNPRGNLENLIKGADNKTYETIKRDITAWSHRDRKVKSTLWETLYTCIYDYENRSFRIILHEGMIDYEFKL